MSCWTLESGGSVVDLFDTFTKGFKVLLVMESSDGFLTGWGLIPARCKCSVNISCYCTIISGLQRIMEWRGTGNIQACKSKAPFYCPGDK